MAWRLAPAISVLRDEINQTAPYRDKASDGTIGDAAHASRNSDHNPWLANTVRAIDIDEDLDGNTADTGADARWLAEYLRGLGKSGDPRLENFGYVIYEGQIAGGNPSRGPGRWEWRPYTGTNAHAKHIHLSVSRSPEGYNSTRPWGLLSRLPQEDDMYTEADRKRDEEVARRVEVLWEDYGQKGKGVRQVIAEIDQRTSDLATGKRPG